MVTKLGALLGVVMGIGWSLILFEAFPGAAGWILLGALVALMIILYVIANAIVSRAPIPSESIGGDFMRYLLVGLNSGLNLILAVNIYPPLLGDAVGVTLGIGLCLLNIVAVFKTISNNGLYQGVLGWANWLLPMSWLVTGLGFVLWILSLLCHLFLYLIGRIGYFRIEAMQADWKTGTFFTRGGFVANLNPIDTAFNMGSFAFVDAKPHEPPVASPEWHTEHEAGHTLNLGAFGSIFHFIGAIDENVTGGRENAFSERLAESNDPASTLTHIIIPMWA